MNLNPLGFTPWPVAFWTTVVYLALFIPLIYVHETVPEPPKQSALPNGLNLTEALADLRAVTGSFHPYNSHANDAVREYYIKRSKDILERNKMDYTIDRSGGVLWRNSLQSSKHDASAVQATANKAPGVTLFDDQISNVTFTYGSLFKQKNTPSTMMGQYFEGNNFYAYIHGKNDPEGNWWQAETALEDFKGKGGVLVNCHIDSVATGFGATDDGMSCVTLLQMLSYFTSEGRQPKHGIVLLFNNAEEDGLLGARAFGYSPLLPFCHSFVNLEGAGAGGRALLFRTTDLQAAEVYGSSPYPFGSVIAANAFEAGVIKSGTDYEVFADSFGQRGLDIAFYTPRSRYHTEDDDSRHTSTRSIWHMLSAALASTEKFSQLTGTVFDGERSDGRQDLVQNGKQTEAVWFDFFGRAWAAMPLRGLFAWTLTLLIATPLILFLVTVLLIKQDKYYFFSGSVDTNSDAGDEKLPLGGWRGLFRFPLAAVFASALTFASILMVGKYNSLIIYSSSYALWAMAISIFYASFWLIARGASYMRPSALHRGYSIMWLFVLTWTFQIFVAVAEDRMHVGAFYFAAFFHTAVFLAFLISLLELFAVPGKKDFVRQMEYADIPGNAAESDEDEAPDNANGDDDENATETTPLRSGEQGYGSGDATGETTTFASRYRRRLGSSGGAANADSGANQPPTSYADEQSWSGRLPSWTWFLQLLILAPIHLILVGSQALVGATSMSMTGVDGSDMLVPLISVGFLSIMLLLPLTPFMHRIKHHLPVFLFLVFVGTFIYNLVAFPFSASYRFKYFFQQVVDIDTGANVVSVDGVPEYVRNILHYIPAAAGQNITCVPSGRVSSCRYDASHVVPNPVDGIELKDLVTIKATKAFDGRSVEVELDAVDTRTCTLKFSQNVYGFSVEGGAPRDRRVGSEPNGGLSSIGLWRRRWEGPWKVTLQLGGDHRSVEARAADRFEVTASCSYSDANEAKKIPALTELKRYAPTWSVVTKAGVGLVEIRKTAKV